MTTLDMTHRVPSGFKLHGQAGLLTIFLAEALLFSGNQIVGRWFTPIVWTGYVLFVDALVYKIKRRSLLVTNRAELLIIVVISIAGWLGVRGWSDLDFICPLGPTQPPTPNPQPPFQNAS